MNVNHLTCLKVAAGAYVVLMTAYLVIVFFPEFVIQDSANGQFRIDIGMQEIDLQGQIVGWFALLGAVVAVIGAAIIATGSVAGRMPFLLATIALLASELLINTPVCKSSLQYFLDTCVTMVSGLILAIAFLFPERTKIDDMRNGSRSS